MNEFKKEHNEFREFFKYCTCPVFDIYNQELTTPQVFMEEGYGNVATLYVMGQYGRIAGVDILLVNLPNCHFVIEIKNKLKRTDFRLYINDTCSYSMIDLVYMVLLLCDYSEALQSIHDYCDTYDKDRPRNLLLNWANDPTWYLLQSTAGREFMSDNRLEFKAADDINPLNELTMNIPTSPGEYTVQKIQTGVRGRLSIHHVEGMRLGMIMDPAGGLVHMFGQHMQQLEVLVGFVPVFDRQPRVGLLHPYIVTYLGELIQQAKTLSRFGVKTDKDITTVIHDLIRD